MKGKTIEDALKVSNREVLAKLGEMPPHKIHCSVLAEEAVKTAIKDYLDKRKNYEDDISHKI